VITADTLQFLQSPRGMDLLAEIAQADLADNQLLPMLTKLRKTYSPEEAAAAVEMARLRQQARGKFGADAHHMLFTDAALQQASHPLVRQYRAQHIDYKTVADLCCGIGADSIAFGRSGAHVIGVDLDPLRIAIARHNAQVLGLGTLRFEVADVRQFDTGDYEGVFFDPARRDVTGRRLFDVEAYIPPLSTIRNWSASQIIVKLSPGVDQSQLADYGGVLEFVSVSGDLKEAILWVEDSPLRTRATLLDVGEQHHWVVQDADGPVTISSPLAWLLEPDPAMIRCGGLRELAIDLGAALLDESIAYLTTDGDVNSPWVRKWQILDWMPFNLKKLRAYLRARHIGQVTVKKRGSPLTPEGLIRKLKLKGDQSCTLVLTQHQGNPIVLICADYTV